MQVVTDSHGKPHIVNIAVSLSTTELTEVGTIAQTACQDTAKDKGTDRYYD